MSLSGKTIGAKEAKSSAGVAAAPSCDGEASFPSRARTSICSMCLICHEEVSTLRGLACPEGHLICSACLQGYVCSLADSAKLRSSNGALDCLGAHQQALSFGRSMVEPLLFGDALRLYLETMETAQTPDVGEVCTPESIQPELNEALNLCCPSCGVFCDPDPDGCIAMKCSSCDVAFCWLCFQACGRDAHPHCRKVHGEYFPPRSVVNQWHRRLRWRQVDKVLQRAFGECPAPKLAVVVEKFNGLLSGLKNSFGRLFKSGPSAEGVGVAAAEAAAKSEAARITPKRKEALREEALRLCARNLADIAIRLWPFPTVEPSVGGMLGVASHVQAAQFGRIDELRALLDDTPELIDQANDRGMTALMAAAHGGRAAVVTMLLERGADITCRDDRGVSALDYAIRENRREVVRALLDGGATIDALEQGLNIKSANMLAEVAKQKGISLCGIQRDQTTAGFRYHDLGPPEAILLARAILMASDLSQAVVTGSLTSINLSGNNLTHFWSDMTGVTELAAALGVNGSLTQVP